MTTTADDPRLAMLSLTALSTEIVAELIMIEHRGVGGHRRRSRGKVFRRVLSLLVARGYTWTEAQRFFQDCRDIAELAEDLGLPAHPDW